jgi:ADP-dependent NAD(P)H-hydrate dehydratase / NAD(P)H-hydrate epimerase
MLDNQVAGATVVALAGNGVKASVALHALRILHGFGAECSAVLAGGERDMRPETARAAAVCESLRLPLLQPRSPAVRNAVADAKLVLDGLVGVGLDGLPREPLASLIRLSNEVRSNALAIECPSGLEPDSGEPLQPTLKARTTLALGLPCAGLFASLAWQFTGELWLCDIGYPPEALEEAQLDRESLFDSNEILRLR